MDSIWERIKNKILNDEASLEVSNSFLEEKIIGQFNDGIDKYSLKNKFLYPTSFKIFLHSKDFHNLRDAFPFIFDSCIIEFTKTLRRKVDVKAHAPHSMNWKFQFIESNDEAVLEGVDNVEQGDVLILYSLLPEGQGPSNGTYIGTKLSSRSKLADSYEINPAALGKVQYQGNDTFTRQIILTDDKFSGVTHHRSTESTTRLTVSGKSFVGGGEVVSLTCDKVMVCGKTGLPSSDSHQVVRIDDVNVSNPHFFIGRDSVNGTYKVTSLASMKLNGRQLSKGASMPLSDGDEITVYKSIRLRFSL